LLAEIKLSTKDVVLLGEKGVPCERTLEGNVPSFLVIAETES